MILARIILGLLDIAPMSGYDVKRYVDTVVTHFWTADKSQVYRTLAGLVADGLARTETVPGTTAPDRLVHHLTDAGRTALHEWLVSALDRQPERDAFLARAFFAGGLDDDELGELLARRRAAGEQLLATLAAMRESTPAPRDRAGRLRLATLENGMRHARTELEWLDDVARELELGHDRDRDHDLETARS
ncbi:PadR family transcriptional regulator [Agromyces sp. SYSU K20354]|uniref:PadR family transcriptional regulator n=1 Tax=Agromyces cavernae TaxID=2898659 RepID=UPI001E2BC230|nr:PadR family transcriptional regulator [Agromyces cavernae]MCD2443205.1 PadR family transcriptional regulator [Agromyces cavernae]